MIVPSPTDLYQASRRADASCRISSRGQHAPARGRETQHGAGRGVRDDTTDSSGPLARTTLGVSIKFGAGVEIYGEGEQAEYAYKVVTGTVRTYWILADGRRQIGSFYLTGEVFGLELGNEHAFSAEAVTESKVLVIKRSALVSLAARDSEVARDLWTLTGRELARAQEHVVLLIKTAQERVAAFLLEMAERRPGGDTIELPMSRQDIADYLGVTIETVSRTFTIMERRSVIALPSARTVVLRDRAALRQ
jgi:CRP/FNR family transcriptional regulator, nitrogen fixation regulation protein